MSNLNERLISTSMEEVKTTMPQAFTCGTNGKKSD
jgi:hypothetical protein